MSSRFTYDFPPTQFHIVSSGYKIAYFVLNPALLDAAIPLVMITGWTGTKEDWQQLALDLANKRTIIAFDNRGMGESDVSPSVPGSASSRFTIEHMAGDVRDLIQHCLGTQRKFHCMGISMGGMITQALITLPSISPRLVSVTLGCTTPSCVKPVPPIPATSSSAQPEQQSSLVELMSKLPTEPLAPEAVRDFIREILRLNYSASWVAANPDQFESFIDFSLKYNRPIPGRNKQLGALMEWDGLDNLNVINSQLSHVPILVIHGDDDKVLSYNKGQYLAEQLQNADLCTFTQTGHCFWISNCVQTRQVLETFFNRHEDRLQLAASKDNHHASKL